MSSTRETSKDKPSIYPNAEPELILLERHSALAQQITTVRHAVTATYYHAHAHIQSVVDRWIDVEQAVERRVKSIISPEEPLTPGVLYVGVATLTGSVLARNRSILLRFTLPPAFLLLSMNHFLPQTSHNLSAYLSSLERAHAPAVAEVHSQVLQHVTYISSATREAWYNSRDKTRSSVERGVSALQDKTGLKLRETLGWGQTSIAKAESPPKSVVDVVGKR